MDREVEKLIREAITALKEGRADEALLVLERTVDPKFRSVEHAHGSLLMHDGAAMKSNLNDFFAEALGHQVAA